MFSLAFEVDQKTADQCGHQTWFAINRRESQEAMFKAVQLAALALLRKSAPRKGPHIKRQGIGTGSAWVAQLVERVLGKDEVTGSIPVPGSRMSIR